MISSWLTVLSKRRLSFLCPSPPSPTCFCSLIIRLFQPKIIFRKFSWDTRRGSHFLLIHYFPRASSSDLFFFVQVNMPRPSLRGLVAKTSSANFPYLRAFLLLQHRFPLHYAKLLGPNLRFPKALLSSDVDPFFTLRLSLSLSLSPQDSVSVASLCSARFRLAEILSRKY